METDSFKMGGSRGAGRSPGAWGPDVHLTVCPSEDEHAGRPKGFGQCAPSHSPERLRPGSPGALGVRPATASFWAQRGQEPRKLQASKLSTQGRTRRDRV